VEYETAERHYAHVDCPATDYVKVTVMGLVLESSETILYRNREGPVFSIQKFW
jgi:translation elongation factor EF-Tu-like GTPase